jgi:hypothetical protein
VCWSWLSQEVLGHVSAPSSPDLQQQVLRDVLVLAEVLMAEVPSPVGCNNPDCLDRRGDREGLLYRSSVSLVLAPGSFFKCSV